MPDYDNYAAAITVRETVLRTALQSAYASGSASSRQFTEDLSHSGATIKPAPSLFLGEPDINCDGTLVVSSDGTPGAVVVTLPLRGPVSVTVGGQTAIVGIAGQAQIAIFPTLSHGTDTSNIAFSVVSDVNVPSWVATVTTPGTPAATVDLLTGDGFRQQLETVLRDGILVGRITLPDIPAGYLIDLPAAATAFDACIRDGVLLIGLKYGDGVSRSFDGNPDNLQDFAAGHDLAAAVNPAAVDLMFTRVRSALSDGAVSNGATLQSFVVTPAPGLFSCSGSISESEGTLNFTFQLVPSMFYTRPGAFFVYVPKPRRVKPQTWPALSISIENLQTDVDQAWWVTLLEGLAFIPSLGGSLMYVDSLIDQLVSTFTDKVTSYSPGTPANRVQKTTPGPGGIAVRVGVDQFDVATDGVRVGISVRPTPSPAVLYGPTIVPQTYADDTLRYILQPPSAVDPADPALRIQWVLEDRDANAVLVDVDGPVADRLRFEFTPAGNAATDFGVTARLYRQIGADVSELGTRSVNLHMRAALAPKSYTRWPWQGKNPQISFGSDTAAWRYDGDTVVNRWSNWHRTDAPCLAVNAPARYRYNVETADRLPFDLKLLENHREGLCSYCFYGGPTGINPHL